jgi:hydroxylamine dehydrogenase
MLLAGAGALLAGAVRADVPKELFDALKLEPSASPKQLYEAITKRYLDPARGAGKGKYAQLWEPIAMSKYFDPHTFYQPPATVKDVAGRQECVECHRDETAGWVRAWKLSAHANLDQIRKLRAGDPRYYKKKAAGGLPARALLGLQASSGLMPY